MPSSKGKPTDPKLRDRVKQKVKKETNKDGSGRGQWSAWKAVKMSKEYEKEGGNYENEAGSKNEPQKGVPRAKPGGTRRKEIDSAKEDDENDQGKPDDVGKDQDNKSKADRTETASNKVSTAKGQSSKASMSPKEGLRRSARVSSKRSALVDEEEPAQREQKKKAKIAKK